MGSHEVSAPARGPRICGPETTVPEPAKSPTITASDLPLDIWDRIIRFVGDKDFAAAMSVSKALRNSPTLYQLRERFRGASPSRCPPLPKDELLQAVLVRSRVADRLAARTDQLTESPRYCPPSFSRDGQTLVTASETGLVRVWDLKKKFPTTQELPHDEPISCASVSPDGRYVATVTLEGTGSIWDVQSGDRTDLNEAYDSGITYVAFSPNGLLAATATDDGVLHVRGTGESSFHATFNHEEEVTKAAFSSDGNFLFTSSPNRTLIWNLKTSPYRAVALNRKAGAPAEFSPDSKHIVCVSANKVRLCDLSKSRPSASIIYEVAPTDWVTSAVFSPDSKTLVVGHVRSSLVFLDVATKCATPCPHSGLASSFSFSPDGRFVLVTSLRDGQIAVSDLRQ